MLLWRLIYPGILSLRNVYVNELLTVEVAKYMRRNAPLSLVTTYAYVNPLVAVLLGVVLLGEAFTPRTGVATVVIVVGVALIVTKPRTARPAPEAIPESVVPDAVDSLQ